MLMFRLLYLFVYVGNGNTICLNDDTQDPSQDAALSVVQDLLLLPLGLHASVVWGPAGGSLLSGGATPVVLLVIPN